MKAVLCAINARYAHTCLALHYLRAACAGTCETVLQEYTINDPISRIAWQLIGEQADVYCFSCYIWNIESVRKAAQTVKLALPGSRIVLGGPEVSFNAEEVLTAEPFADFIIAGEGEQALPLLLETGLKEPEKAPNLYYRKNGGILYSFTAPLIDMDKLPDAYAGGFEKGRVVYYESSRGCPFTCSFCLSPAMGRVRYRPLEQVFADMDRFIRAGVKQVKFVDRTFNADAMRARKIFSYLMEKSESTHFHFEIAGHILDDETSSLLKGAKKGLFQFEIGVQSASAATLDAIGRRQDLAKVEHAVEALREAGNIHLHLDLIAGLPLERLEDFRHSLERVFALRPDVIQTGLLKVLHGSRIKGETEKYGIIHCQYPPYEVVATQTLPTDDMARIRRAAHAYNLLCNKGGQATAVAMLAACGTGLFDLLEAFSLWMEGRGYPQAQQSREGTADMLQEYVSDMPAEEKAAATDLIRYGYFKGSHRMNMPGSLSDGLAPEEKEISRTYLVEHVKKTGNDRTMRDMLICAFDYDVTGYDKGQELARNRNLVLFDYSRSDLCIPMRLG
jgi:radical SAM superfamily enzyme YgiQ (UPF0313 family)